MSEAWPESGRLAAVDFGTVRLGLAISDAGRILASPLKNYTRRGVEADAAFLRKLVEEEQISAFVVGLPVHMSGQESQKSGEARAFGSWLIEVTNRPVRFFDERYTSAAAERLLMSANLSRKKRKERRDMLAAQIILTAFLESGRYEDCQPLDD